jgi:hypothetical protein
VYTPEAIRQILYWQYFQHDKTYKKPNIAEQAMEQK